MFRRLMLICGLLALVQGIKANSIDTTINVRPLNSHGVVDKEALADALRQAREFKRLYSTADGYQFYTANKNYPHVTIRLEKGRYELFEPLILRPEDSNLTFEAPQGAEIMGSIMFMSFNEYGFDKPVVFDYNDMESDGNVVRPRQIWVGGEKAVMARNVASFDDMPRILNYDKVNRVLWLRGSDIPDKIIDAFKRDDFKGVQPELVLHQMWEVSILRIKEMWRDGDSVGVTFYNPEARIQFQHPWPGPMYKSEHDSPYYIQNLNQLLDTRGEWMFTPSGTIVYYPKAGVKSFNAEIPFLENLVRIEGTSERPVTNVDFRGITFSYTTWTRPNREGHVPLQAGMYLTEAYKLRPPIDRTDNHKLDNQEWLGRARAAVEVSYGRNVMFNNCSFTHLGGSGIDFVEGCKGGGIDSCSFSDIAMNGLVCGSFSPAGLETHLPYQPEDLRVVCDSQSVSNSLFTDIGNEDWGCCAITAGYVSDMRITDNTIHDIPYTGISLGWGWNRTKNCMHDNYVARNNIRRFAQHMTDCAGIYTLGNQPGTVIEENAIADAMPPVYVHDPDHWFWLYTDEGSSNITIRNNRCPSDRFLKNANGPNNVWENNGPKVKLQKTK